MNLTHNFKTKNFKSNRRGDLKITFSAALTSVVVMLISGWYYIKGIFTHKLSNYRRLIMSFLRQKAAEEVTERALVPYVKEKIVESGITTAIVKWVPWT